MNNKIFKVGILVFILIVPTFLFIVAHITGENVFGVPKLYSTGVIETERNGVLVVDSTYHKIGPFKFLNQDSVLVSENNLKGKISVISFISTQEEENSPIITSNLTKLQSIYGSEPWFKMFTFTLNPEKDTPNKLNDYKIIYDLSDKPWDFLTGYKKNEIVDLIKEQFFIELENKEVEFLEQVVLVDTEGIIRGEFIGTDLTSLDELISAIVLVEQENKD